MSRCFVAILLATVSKNKILIGMSTAVNKRRFFGNCEGQNREFWALRDQARGFTKIAIDAITKISGKITRQ